MSSDIKYSLRSLLKAPGFTLIALLTLGIGIGANTAIFSFVNGVMLKPLPYPDAERIVAVMEKRPDGGSNLISTLNYLDWKKENTVFQYMAAETGGSVTLTGVSEPKQLAGTRVSADYFSIFGIEVALGRTFAAGEDQPGKDQVVVISDSFWQSQFGGDPSVIGRSITLDGRPNTVIGVVAKENVFNRGGLQIWRPLAFAPENLTRNFHWFVAYAKLKPGVTLEQARANMDAIGARIAHDYPDSKKGWSVQVDLFSDLAVGKELKKSLFILLAVVGMVLLIGCTNLANLMLARGKMREREVAIRSALGAGRGRLVRQFLTESVLLSVGGGVVGLALGYGLMVGLKMLLPRFALPGEAVIGMDGQVLLFTSLLALITGIVCGLAPALQATRTDLTHVIKQGGGASTGHGHHRTRTALVVAEIALTFVLLTGAGLLLRSFAELQNVTVGDDASRVLTANFPIPQQKFADAESFNAYIKQVSDSIAALPGVREAAFASALPMQGWGHGMPFQRADKPVVDPANRNACFFKMVTPDYFEAAGIRLIKGRTLNEQDKKGSQPVAVISEAMSKRYFADEDPIGKQLLVEQMLFGKAGLGKEIPWVIVGVTANEKVNFVGEKESSPGMYVPFEQNAQLGQSLILRTESDPALLYQPIRDAVKRINPDQTLPEMKTLEQIKNESLGNNRLYTLLLSVFAGVALLLAAVGIYGVMAYSVAQRTREIGVRIALGAQAHQVMGLVMKQGLGAMLVGLVAGAAIAFVASRLLASMLFETAPTDPLTFIGAALVIVSMTLTACWVPARRAMKVDPLVALRAE